VILGYLPKDKKRWGISIEKQEKAYNQFINQFLSDEKYKDGPYVRNKNDERWAEY